jgi:hypothetical protein
MYASKIKMILGLMILSTVWILGVSWCSGERTSSGSAPRRYVCSKECQSKFDLANGIHDCSACSNKCNLMHKYCRDCAKKLNACEVCGKQMPKDVKSDPDKNK